MSYYHISRLLLLCYGLAGVTALGYEVLWSRMLGVLLGATNVAVAITVSTFMLGLGLGSLGGAVMARRATVARCLAVLAMVEAMVACYALSLPWLLLHVLDASSWLQHGRFAFSYGMAIFLLLLPSLLLGLAFPMAVRAGESLAQPLHRLYGWNAAGGVAGALLPLLLLPVLGWAHALQSLAAMGLLLAVALAALARRCHATPPASANTLAAQPPSPKMLLMYALIGAGALMLEVIWIRMYGMVLLRTEYVMAMILAVFLIGIAAGSLLAPRLPRTLALRWMPVILMLTGSLAGLLLPALSQWLNSLQADSLWLSLLEQGSVLMLCTLPVTLILGAWLPLLSTGDDQATFDGAWLYGANSTGAFAGGLLACFVLIPWLGSMAVWWLALTLIALAACYWGGRTWLRAAGILSCGLVLLLFKGDFPAVASLLGHGFEGAHELMVYEDALSITHVVEQKNGYRILLADLQRLDASTEPTAVVVQQNEARLPMLLHPRPARVLFLGLGTGITASAALDWPTAKVTAVELSQGAIQAARTAFAASNHDVSEHIHIVHDDARRFLMASGQRWDVIIGDLFHPDLVGRGQLLSLQQFARASAHLSPQGVFCQWLALNQFDTENLTTILRTFARVFPHNAVFLDGFRLAMVGFTDAMPAATSLQQALAQQSSARQQRMVGGESLWTWLGRYRGRIQDMIGQTSGPVQDEWWPQIEYRLPQRRFRQQQSLASLLRWLKRHRVSRQQLVKRWQLQQPDERQKLEAAWLASHVLLEAHIQQIAPSLRGPDPVRLFQLAYRADPRNRWAGFAVADAMYDSLEHGLPAGMNEAEALQRILAIRPDHQQARARWCSLQTSARAKQACREQR